MRGNDEKVVEIEIERLHDFKNHPFKVQADSPKQIQRYLKLNDLIPKLLDKVDDETMGFTIGVELAYLRKKIKRLYWKQWRIHLQHQICLRR